MSERSEQQLVGINPGPALPTETTADKVAPLPPPARRPDGQATVCGRHAAPERPRKSDASNPQLGGRAPTPPAGVLRQEVVFKPAFEAPRGDWIIADGAGPAGANVETSITLRTCSKCSELVRNRPCN